MQFEAKTVEEATQEGLNSLGITEEEAEITVIEQPTKGLFGRMKGKAVVSIVKKEEIEGLPKKAKKTATKKEKTESVDAPKKTTEEKETNGGELKEEKFLKTLLDYLDIKAEIKVGNDGENETLTLVTEDSASVIGHRGELLDALQTLTSAVANIGNEEYRKVVVDCENYRDRREETLISLANKLAVRATEMRREVVLEPMNPFERRIIHTALANSETVTTRSDGKEPQRYVVIVPNDKDENSRPYIAARKNDHGGNRRFNRNDRNGGYNRNSGRGGYNTYNNRNGNNRSHGSGFTGEKRKTSSGFGTYLGNSLKDQH